MGMSERHAHRPLGDVAYSDQPLTEAAPGIGSVPVAAVGRWLVALPILAAPMLQFTASAATAPVTFTKDVLPIFQKNCQGCHRPGEAAPFSLLNYEQSRPWAAAIKEAVVLRRMPPWFADPHIGKFSNDRSLSQPDVATIVAWVDSGAPEGDPKDAPPPLQFSEGWRIPNPDMVIEMPHAFHVPASGVIDLVHVVVPANFNEDRWVRCAEVRPGNRSVVHHIVVFTREPGSKWLKDAKPGVPYIADPKKHKKDSGVPGETVGGYTPGAAPMQLKAGQAILIKKGSDIVFQLHYTTNGKAAQDQSKFGLVFASEPPKQRVFSLAAYNDNFTIPAGDPNYRVDSVFDLGTQAELIGMGPHMHTRGKDFEFRAIFPNGESRTLLRVLNYNFAWQLSYDLAQPITLPKGTRIQCTAHFDNSPNNPNNPDPKKDVSWGDQTWDEMMIGFFSVAFDIDLPVKSLTAEPGKSDKPRAKSRKELEALLAFQDAQTPDLKLQAIENVLANFADTEFKVMLLESAIEIEQRQDNLAQVLFYGERLLDADPQGAFARVTMAGEIARHTHDFDLDKDQKLAKAEKYARDGLDAAKIMLKPRGMKDEEWEGTRKDFQAQAYEALGEVATLRKKDEEAAGEYLQAVQVAATPDAAIYIRLGQAYENAGHLAQAADAYDKALALPNITAQVKSIALAKKEEVTRRK